MVSNFSGNKSFPKNSPAKTRCTEGSAVYFSNTPNQHRGKVFSSVEHLHYFNAKTSYFNLAVLIID